jgi:MinD superfamily P-loop ATPase
MGDSNMTICLEALADYTRANYVQEHGQRFVVFVNDASRFSVVASTANFHCSDKCTLCGKCVRVCPLENIHIEDGKVKWGGDCEQCMACIQWCPAEAINYANATAKRTRYRHPDVEFSDILGQ